MASQEELYHLLGKALAEPDFRAQLSADPLGAAASINVTLNAEDVAALQASDMSKMAEGLDERLSKTCLSYVAPLLQTGPLPRIR